MGFFWFFSPVPREICGRSLSVWVRRGLLSLFSQQWLESGWMQVFVTHRSDAWSVPSLFAPRLHSTPDRTGGISLTQKCNPLRGQPAAVTAAGVPLTFICSCLWFWQSRDAPGGFSNKIITKIPKQSFAAVNKINEFSPNEPLKHTRLSPTSRCPPPDLVFGGERCHDG